MIDWDDLQPPTGEPNRKDSWIYTGFPDSSPKCCVCGEDANRLIVFDKLNSKWICDTCSITRYLPKHVEIEPDWLDRVFGPYQF